MHVLLLVGNAPGLATGYGGQAALLLRSVLAADEGTRATVLCWGTIAARRGDWTPVSTAVFCRTAAPQLAGVRARLPPHEREAWDSRVTWLANPYGTYPATIMKAHINDVVARVRADALVTLQDVFMMQPGAFACPALAWQPLHFAPLEKSTSVVLADFDVLVGISAYGTAVLRAHFGPHQGAAAWRPCLTIPHGRSPSVFSPLPTAADASDRGRALADAARADARAALGWPPLDTHVTLLVASNSEASGRKAFDAQLAAWQAFADARARSGGGRAELVVHAEAVRAYDLGRVLEYLGELPYREEDLASRNGGTAHAERGLRGPRVRVVPRAALGATPDSGMADMYRAADVLLAASAAEGCGVPILEAQLCGCPVVTNATTAMLEETVLGAAAPAGAWIARMDFNAGWHLPDVPAVAAALAAVAAWDGGTRAAAVAAALPRLRARYSEAAVVEAWVALWRRLARDVLPARTPCRTWAPPPLPPTERRLALPPRRRMFLQAAAAANALAAAAADAAAALTRARTLHAALVARLAYVDAALGALAPLCSAPLCGTPPCGTPPCGAPIPLLEPAIQVQAA